MKTYSVFPHPIRRKDSLVGRGIQSDPRTELEAKAASCGTCFRIWILLGVVLLALATSGRAAPGDENWDDRFTSQGVNGNVYALASIGSNVYVGGTFTQAGGSNMQHLARWNGRSWSRLGTGVAYPGGNAYVYALTASGTNLYVGGSFRTAGGLASSLIAKWDGNNWSALGGGITDPGPQPTVNAIAVDGSSVYAGGSFQAFGAVTATNIAKWNGLAWSSIGGVSGINASVTALAVSGGELYVGGRFGTAGTVPVANLAKWNGTSWSDIGGGVNGNVTSLAVMNGELFVYGSFTTVGGSLIARGFAKWNGTAWSTPQTGLVTNVGGFAMSDGQLYLGGNITNAGVSLSRFARWDGVTWNLIGNDGDLGASCNFLGLTTRGSNVFFGGNFANPLGAVLPNNVIEWDGNDWRCLGQGLDFAANSLAVIGTNVYAAGSGRAGGQLVTNIAKWDGYRWSTTGGKLNASVLALAASGTNLYASGSFTSAGGVPASHIARWDGNTWWPLGSGITSGVARVLAVSGTNLYVGGSFTAAGGVSANYVARWDGSNWFPLGSGLGGEAFALAASGNDVYAGGNFTSAGGVTVYNIAKWNGSSWSALGTDPMFGSVGAIAVSGGNVYVAGGFFFPNNANLNNLAVWNGSSWSALGYGVSGSVNALAVRSNTVWISGVFTSVSGVPANRIAKWSGSAWSALGAGTGPFSDSAANSLVLLGNDLYAAGGFQFAGSKSSRFFGIWHEPLPILTIRFVPGGSFALNWNSLSNETYQLHVSTNLAQPFAPFGNPIPSGGANTSYTNAVGSGSAQFFQIRQLP